MSPWFRAHIKLYVPSATIILMTVSSGMDSKSSPKWAENKEINTPYLE
jgi:hypothetical protein